MRIGKKLKGFFSWGEKREQVNVNDWKDFYSFEKGYDITPFSNTKEAVYFACIKIISEAIGKCSLNIKKKSELEEKVMENHPLYEKLRLRPNPYMSAVDCYKTFVAIAKNYGKAGLYIDRDFDGEVQGLYPVKINQITIDDKGIIDKDNAILYSFSLLGDSNEYDCLNHEIIILNDYTLDGVNTTATGTAIKENLDTSINSQNYLNKLFKNGLTNKIAVQLTSALKEDGELKKIQNKFNKMYSSTGKIFTIPAGYQVQPLNLTLADAQFIDLRKLSKEEIAMAFRVPLSKLGWIKENAKSEEQDNLQFLQDCLQIIFTQIEQEMDWKLLTPKDRRAGLKIRFNINTFLRVDAKTQAEVICNYVKHGVYDLDTAKRILGVKQIGGEPIITFPSGQVSLEQIRSGGNNGDNNSGTTGD